MKRTTLIDGDILLVSTGFALEKEVEWEEDVWTLSVDLKEWKEAILRSLDDINSDLGATDFIVCLSQGQTFRHDIYPDYKGNRKKGRKPVGLNVMKNWLVEEHNAKIKPGIEADDTMGILATHPKLIKGEKIIVSQDKDMKTIPCSLYRGGDVIEITEDQADYWHMFQTLTGDTTDGYSGCPGIGKVTAEKLLEGPKDTWWSSVVRAYETKGLTVEDALLQARLARILRYQDYNFKSRKVKLWNPDLK